MHRVVNLTATGNVVARALKLIVPTADYQITADNYRSKNQPTNSDELANKIIVDTQPLRPADTAEEVYSSDEKSLAAGATTTVNAKYQEEPVIDATAVVSSSSGNITITSSTYYAWGADITLENTGSSSDTFTLTINAKPLKVRGSERITAKDDQSITENGEIEYEFPDNHLVQTEAVAQKIADKLLASFKDPRRDIELDWRGNPALELADIITAMEYESFARFYAIRQELQYDGALTAKLEGRKKD